MCLIQFFDSFKSTKKNPESTVSETPSLKVGDKVVIKTTQGEMKATITDVSSDKYEIKYANPKYGKQWVDKVNVSKQ